MKKKQLKGVVNGLTILLLLMFSLATEATAAAYPVQVKDARGHILAIQKRPTAVVCLVPSVTEMIFFLSCQDAVVGITYHDTWLAGSQGKPIVGGYFTPSSGAIDALNPDLLIVAPGHTDILKHVAGGRCQVLVMDMQRLDDAACNLRLLGRIFDKKEEAEAIIARNDQQIAIIKQKVARIPPEKRRRVIRLMGSDSVMAPGDDSFQNEMIAAAGGIPPSFGKTGAIISVTPDEWQRFNPQIIYGCGQDRQVAKAFFDKPGWKDVAAVKNGRISYFPCELTCRAATHTGYFITWLSAVIYADAFADSGNLVQAETITHTRSIDIDLPYISHARIAYSHIYDFPNKTLMIDFVTPQTIVSTLEGQRSGTVTVGNHYSPPPSWNIDHKKGMNAFRNKIFQVIGITEAKTAALWDMDIRSSFTSLVNPATGTGSDNILVVQGTGPVIEYTGGHAKMGELIASAVYVGVQEAVLKQNKLTPVRSIFDRLKERNLSVHNLAFSSDCQCSSSSGEFAAAVEQTLLDKRWSGFLEAALSLSDAYERGLVGDLESIRQWSRSVASDIAGADIGTMKDIIRTDGLPIVIKTALNALFTGVQSRLSASNNSTGNTP
jgi:ABC-type Fe3+-hydroxamate transport system substrate-binding protein